MNTFARVYSAIIPLSTAPKRHEKTSIKTLNGFFCFLLYLPFVHPDTNETQTNKN